LNNYQTGQCAPFILGFAPASSGLNPYCQSGNSDYNNPTLFIRPATIQSNNGTAGFTQSYPSNYIPLTLAHMYVFNTTAFSGTVNSNYHPQFVLAANATYKAGMKFTFVDIAASMSNCISFIYYVSNVVTPNTSNSTIQLSTNSVSQDWTASPFLDTSMAGGYSTTSSITSPAFLLTQTR
jgi:hypothetical protein